MKDVVIYTKSWCGCCTRAKALLARKGAAFTEISDDDALRDQKIEKSGGRRTVPQVFIGDMHVGGCDDLCEFERKNELVKCAPGIGPTGGRRYGTAIASA